METKFDFEDENLEKDIKKNASGLFNGILVFIQSVFRFNNDIDKVFKELEKFTSESWDDKASNLFCEGL